MSNMLENQVKALVARHFGISPSKVRLDASFLGDLGGDALDLIELSYQFEAVFNVSLGLPERDSLTTVRSVADWLRRHGVAG